VYFDSKGATTTIPIGSTTQGSSATTQSSGATAQSTTKASGASTTAQSGSTIAGGSTTTQATTKASGASTTAQSGSTIAGGSTTTTINSGGSASQLFVEKLLSQTSDVALATLTISQLLGIYGLVPYDPFTTSMIDFASVFSASPSAEQIANFPAKRDAFVADFKKFITAQPVLATFYTDPKFDTDPTAQSLKTKTTEMEAYLKSETAASFYGSFQEGNNFQLLVDTFTLVKTNVVMNTSINPFR
jgi:hypothetical protein